MCNRTRLILIIIPLGRFLKRGWRNMSESGRFGPILSKLELARRALKPPAHLHKFVILTACKHQIPIGLGVSCTPKILYQKITARPRKMPHRGAPRACQNVDVITRQLDAGSSARMRPARLCQACPCSLGVQGARTTTSRRSIVEGYR